MTEKQVLEGASEEERAEYHEAKSKMEEFDVEYQKLLDNRDQDSVSEESRKTFQEAVGKLYEAYAPYRSIMYSKYSMNRSHGYVWIFKGVKD